MNSAIFCIVHKDSLTEASWSVVIFLNVGQLNIIPKLKIFLQIFVFIINFLCHLDLLLVWLFNLVHTIHVFSAFIVIFKIFFFLSKLFLNFFYLLVFLLLLLPVPMKSYSKSFLLLFLFFPVLFTEKLFIFPHYVSFLLYQQNHSFFNVLL
jgi:hypothetical protein